MTFNNKVNANKEEQVVTENKYETHTVSTRTVTVGGNYPYVKYSDLIIGIPEEYFLNFNNRDYSVTYDDVVLIMLYLNLENRVGIGEMVLFTITGELVKINMQYVV